MAGCGVVLSSKRMGEFLVVDESLRVRLLEKFLFFVNLGDILQYFSFLFLLFF
jgi:hypothetical protein